MSLQTRRASTATLRTLTAAQFSSVSNSALTQSHLTLGITSVKPEGAHRTNSTNRAQENSQNLGFCIIKMRPVIPEKGIGSETGRRPIHSSVCTCQRPSLAKLSPTVTVGTNA